VGNGHNGNDQPELAAARNSSNMWT